MRRSSELLLVLYDPSSSHVFMPGTQTSIWDLIESHVMQKVAVGEWNKANAIWTLVFKLDLDAHTPQILASNAGQICASGWHIIHCFQLWAAEAVDALVIWWRPEAHPWLTPANHGQSNKFPVSAINNPAVLHHPCKVFYSPSNNLPLTSLVGSRGGVLGRNSKTDLSW